MNGAPHPPEIIRSDDVLHRGDVGRVETKGEIVKIYAAIGISGAALVIGCAILGISAYTGKSDLQTWATGLISGIAGAAIAYGFNARTSS
jgi:hypothetical protein